MTSVSLRPMVPDFSSNSHIPETFALRAKQPRGVRIVKKVSKGFLVLFSFFLLFCTPSIAKAWDEAAEAARLLADADFKGGLIVHIGCGEGRLTSALCARDSSIVHGLDSSAREVSRARASIAKQGLGGRVSFSEWSPPELPFGENLVNLLVVEQPGWLPREEVMRVLTPRGAAMIRQETGWERIVKPWPEEIDEWSHWLHGPDGNAVARDQRAGPPRRLQWMASPLWSRHHNTVPSVTAQVSANGRLFYIADEAPASMHGSAPDKWVLTARDAFNGLLLWQRPITEWGWEAWSADWTCRFTVPTHIPRRLVAAGDRLYVTLGFNAPLSELDAATGEELRTFEGSECTDEILHEHGRLIVSLNAEEQKPGGATEEPQGLPSSRPVRKSVAMFDASSGKMLWRTGEFVGLQSKTGSMDRINHLSLVTGGGQVFFADRDELVSLSWEDGRELWRVRRPRVPEHKMRYNIRITDMCTLVYNEGANVLFFAQLNPDRRIDWREVRGQVHGFDARTGDRLWSRPCASWGWGHPPDVFFRDSLVWVGDYENDNRKSASPRNAGQLSRQGQWGKQFRSAFYVGLNPRTGEVERDVSVFDAFNNGHHHRCYRNKATDRFLMTSYRGFEFIDWHTGETSLNHWVRGTCRLGGFPCNGLIYSNPHPCECYIDSKLNGVLALSPAEPALGEVGGAQRLVKGPAYTASWPSKEDRPAVSQIRDWPMFRRDIQRTGVTPKEVDPASGQLWKARAGSDPLTGCTAGGDLLFTTCPATNEVVALHTEEGQAEWRFRVAAAVDTPPTFYRRRLYFGCADGWVYCLRASDGAEIWRFRAAPDDRLVGAFGRLQSAWPVHGSIIVHDDLVYVVAGRSSFLDGGIFASVLDAASGRLMEQKRVASSHDMKVGTGRLFAEETGALSDLLVCDEEANAVYMRDQRLFPLASSAQGSKEKPLSEVGLLHALGGLRDDNWFSRTRWFIGNKPYAEYMVFDSERVYGVRARPKRSANGGFFTPEQKGYELFAASREAEGKKGPSGDWSVRVPVRVSAMVVTGRVLFAAGTPDVLDAQDPWVAYEGRNGGVLLVVDADSGNLHRKLDLNAAPSFDGMSASSGRLYLATRDGQVLCFGRT